MARAHRKGKTPLCFFCQLPSGLARMHARLQADTCVQRCTRLTLHSHTLGCLLKPKNGACFVALSLRLSVGATCGYGGGVDTLISKQWQNVQKYISWFTLPQCLVDHTQCELSWLEIEQLAPSHFITPWNPQCHKDCAQAWYKPRCIHLLCFFVEKSTIFPVNVRRTQMLS